MSPSSAKAVSSRFTWLDHSEAERKRALDAIGLFLQRETVDELGLAGIRDVLADLLVPGTSTIQSRVRYFLFVPWIYRDLERRGVSAEKVARLARKAEFVLMKALLSSADSNDLIGVFGREAGERIKRLPSSVYWNGLARLGIRFFRGSLERYHASFGRSDRSAEDGVPAEIAGEDGVRGNWDPHLPAVPEGFPDAAQISLRRVDAEYLLDRLRRHANGSLFHRLADDERKDEESEAPWGHPVARQLDERMTGILEHARCFSEVMHGAALLYNRMLSRALPNEEWVADYMEWLEEWGEMIEERQRDLQRWNRSEFWALILRENPRIPGAARSFVERWCALVLGDPKGRRALGPVAEELVARREHALKGDRSRLRSRAHLEQWRGASGAQQFTYRWGICQSMAREIRKGLAQ